MEIYCNMKHLPGIFSEDTDCRKLWKPLCDRAGEMCKGGFGFIKSEKGCFFR